MGGWSGWVAASRLGGFGSQALGWWLCPRIRAQQLSPSCPALSRPPGAECSQEAAFLSGLDCAAGPPLQAEHSLTWKTAHLLIWLSWVWAPNQGPRGILLPLRGQPGWLRVKEGLGLGLGPCGRSPGDLGSFPDLPGPHGQAGTRLLTEQVRGGAWLLHSVPSLHQRGRQSVRHGHQCPVGGPQGAEGQDGQLDRVQCPQALWAEDRSCGWTATKTWGCGSLRRPEGSRQYVCEHGCVCASVYGCVWVWMCV